MRTLDQYLQEPVNFLKLGIEGAEVEVLNESEPYLSNGRHLFCEFHFGEGLARGRLVRLLEVLDRNDFHYTIGKCRTTVTPGNPFKEASNGKSLNIYAVKS